MKFKREDLDFYFEKLQQMGEENGFTLECNTEVNLDGLFVDYSGHDYYFDARGLTSEPISVNKHDDKAKVTTAGNDQYLSLIHI